MLHLFPLSSPLSVSCFVFLLFRVVGEDDGLSAGLQCTGQVHSGKCWVHPAHPSWRLHPSESTHKPLHPIQDAHEAHLKPAALDAHLPCRWGDTEFLIKTKFEDPHVTLCVPLLFFRSFWRGNPDPSPDQTEHGWTAGQPAEGSCPHLCWAPGARLSRGHWKVKPYLPQGTKICKER